ncbi:bifunctional cobalt-precorrin-7 (C(5))-methyltransferase/cobalt-precorrin-6B (C(15))-methyltransferase [Fundidesulfovibrio putealis]|uniref:bifunctional cobalt-precorrin-7 (C(5))-methyltransferase/cobalt-precorrin-6B (C(15))-methyltransferase n=1 Tax=Fundidesulfovibrio putealis TaxID=270496 RepID=UPI00041884D3|nr:bifunctional cobalt-precorrin-7 (C(5))-methyltransferase/cobalt-precorrin-6B (C(15))-methyltransferase [Fundidesulfovibrio putealis]
MKNRLTDPLIEVLGLGMGSSLNRAEMERLVSADVLAGGARLLARFAHLPGERIVVGSPLSEALERMAKARAEGLRVAVLADGDPLFYGIGTRLVEHFGADALHFTPGITAVQAACARLGLTWNDLAAVSLHGRDDPGPLLAALAASGRAAVYTDQVNTPSAIGMLLLEYSLDDAVLWVCENLGGPEERLRRLSPAEAAREEFAPLNLVIVQIASASDARPMLGRPDDFYHRHDGLITKGPARACSVAALRLTPDAVLWDVGAGCGSVGIEALALMPRGRVFAVERDPERHQAIKENIRRSGAWLVKAVKGAAPEAFVGLPDPDRVFVGGSLGNPGAVGAAKAPASGKAKPGALAEACRRLKPGGRIVANTVLLGSLHAALEHFQALGWPVEVTQVQAGVSAPLAGDLRLSAQNPIFIVAADKPSSS